MNDPEMPAGRGCDPPPRDSARRQGPALRQCDDVVSIAIVSDIMESMGIGSGVWVSVVEVSSAR